VSLAPEIKCPDNFHDTRIFCKLLQIGQVYIKSEIGSIGPLLFSIYTLRSLKANQSYLKAPTNFLCEWIIFRVVSDTRRERGIAIVQQFDLETRLDSSPIFVLG
jgi:hypothetical protein